jgi:hypothetical protein
VSRTHTRFTPELADYLFAVTDRENEALRLERADTERHSMAGIQSSPEQCQFLHLMARLVGAKKTLEIGVFLWVTARGGPRSPCLLEARSTRRAADVALVVFFSFIVSFSAALMGHPQHENIQLSQIHRPYVLIARGLTMNLQNNEGKPKDLTKLTRLRLNYFRANDDDFNIGRVSVPQMKQSWY